VHQLADGSVEPGDDDVETHDLLDASESLGTSTEGRAIRGRRFGGAGPALLVMGGVHGDEPAIEWFKEQLAEKLPATEVIVPQPGEEHVI